MSELTIRNGIVLASDETMIFRDIRISDKGKIEAIDSVLRGEKELNASGLFVLPGWIDLHTHGIGFTSVLSEKDSLDDYAAMEAENGCTTFYPTLFAHPYDLIRQLQVFREKSNDLKKHPQIEGFRLESPYLSKPGGGLLSNTAKISRALTDRILEAGGGLIKIWDISPELDFATEEIAYLTAQGIRCSIAHTSCDIAQVQKAIRAGACSVTHLFNTFDVPTVSDPGVYPTGLLDYLLVEDSLYGELIPDGTHVHVLHGEKAFRCKPRNKIIFVTDSHYGSGLKPGEYHLPAGWGDVVIENRRNGVRRKDQGMILAGSAMTPLDSFVACIELYGKDIATASRVCSKNPACLMGLNKGEIVQGKDADLVLLDSRFHVACTISAGRIIYYNKEMFKEALQ